MHPFDFLHLLILIWLTTTLSKAQTFNIDTGCNLWCGEVKIPFPFGIGRNCSANEWLAVDCMSSKPYLSSLDNMEVVHIESRTVTVKVPTISPVDWQNQVKIGQNPFLISGLHNTFVVEGCGTASLMENGTIISGCSTTCGNNNTVSYLNVNDCFGVGCCQTTIPRDLKSFTFNLTRLEMGSAYLVATNYVNKFSIQSNDTFVPISLSWNETVKPKECIDMCGEVSIPYPFGIGRHCAWDNWFVVDCNSSRPYLSALNNVEVLVVSLDPDAVTVNVSVTPDCEKSVEKNNLVLNRSAFMFSGFDNLFVVNGCGTASIMEENGTIVAGCSTTCGNDTIGDDIKNCFGIGCCQTRFPHHMESFIINRTRLESRAGNGTCGTAFLVDRNLFYKGRFSHHFVPITLSWTKMALYHSTECETCLLNGGNCYPNEFQISGIDCIYDDSSRINKKPIGVFLGVGISIVLLFSTVISYTSYKVIKKAKVKRRKQQCFRRNGGLLLKQQEASDIGLVDKTILFTSDELEKATDNFNENRVLGRGGQGTVYKGMLADGRIVAIKKSKVIDESQLQEFINEVVILSQVNHRNVVKLLGCCLETDVPLLVSEFISNGTLYDFIQDVTGEFSFSLNIRLQIATEVAGALSYLHSSTSIPIYHRDIKTTNILLDEKHRAKISDFGTSRFVHIDQTHLTTLVKGTFGYLDPEYFQSSQFTEKSDVYSFGVVLLEPLTREKPISLTRFGENRSLVAHFMLAMEEGRVMSIYDTMVVKEGSRSELLVVANLALRCLNLNGKNRPTMKEVVSELECIRKSHVPCMVHANFGHVMPCEGVPMIYGEPTSSMTIVNNYSQ